MIASLMIKGKEKKGEEIDSDIEEQNQRRRNEEEKLTANE